jgi:CBS domain containing-hemolysin-like protein
MTALQLLLAAVLLAANAVFVGAEFAVLSARRTALEGMAVSSSRARVAVAAGRQLSTMLAAAQLGITIASLGLGAVAEPAVAHVFTSPLGALGLPDGVTHGLAFAVALLLVVAAHMVLGEMVPKNLALAGPERAAVWLAPPLVAFSRMTRPVLRLLNAGANGTLRLARVQLRDEISDVYTPSELAALLAESREHGMVDAVDHALLSGALTLEERRVAEVMVPWPDVVRVSTRTTVEELEAIALRTGRSRYPVLRPASIGRAGTLAGRQVAGVVHVDLLIRDQDMASTRRRIPTAWIAPVATVAPEMSLGAAIVTLHRGNGRLAVVAGRDGPVGIVTREDLLDAMALAAQGPVPA